MVVIVHKYLQVAEDFRALLRTEHYPEGAEIAALPEIQATTGASLNTAQQALNWLAAQGEVLVRPGAKSVVLPEPSGAGMAQLVRELNEAVARYQAEQEDSTRRFRAVTNRIRAGLHRQANKLDQGAS